MQKTVAIIVLLATLVVSNTSALRCLSCDSATDPSCGYSHNDTLGVPVIDCPVGVGQCYISNINPDTNHIVRGCRLEDNVACGDFGCFLCPTDNCNDMQYLEETCTSCETDPTNALCEWNVADNHNPIVCPETTFERSGCYLHIEGGKYKRDCVANLDEEMYEKCLSGDDCKICKGNNCNSKDEFPRCYTCDSTVDENCVYRPDGSFIQTCKNYDDHCVAFAVADGKTGRGCSSETSTEPTFCPGTNCVECNTPECNAGVVPAYRIHCYQCSDDQVGCTEDQEMFRSYRRACNNFNFQDQCFTYEDKENFFRGCVSDKSPASTLCAQQPDNCITCTENDCNSAPAALTTCYHCSQNDLECFLETSTSKKCQTAAGTGQTESCYYHKVEHTDIIQMGCTLDDEEFCKENECLTCSGSNCNAQYFPRKPQLACHKCADNEQCPWKQIDVEVPIACEETVYYGDVESCYYFKYEAQDVRRGCTLDDGFCTTHNCKTCSGNYCNNEAEKQSCIQCNSTLEQFATCGEDARDLNATPCEEDAYFADRGCYSLKTDDDVVIRGCWNDASDEHVAFCAVQDAPCQHCVGEGCNNHDHGGSANLIVAIPLLILSVMASLLIQQ